MPRKIRRSTRIPLVFKNPFKTTGFRHKHTRLYSGPLPSEGYTRAEQAAEMKKAMHLRDLTNSGIIKQMNELGVIPDDIGVNMADYMSDTVALPEGVQSLAQVEKQGEIDRQIERYRAKILTEKERETKALVKLAKKRKASEYRKKVIQWLAESDELDEVPIEFQEEVNEYYNKLNAKQAQSGDRKRDAVKRARDERKRREEQEEEEKRIRRGYWDDNILDRLPAPSYTYNSQDYNVGHGCINGGWRAPRLHRLVHPMKPLDIGDSPDKIIEKQKEALDARREQYKSDQTYQRGTTPPKSMIERAMPTTVEPLVPLPQRAPALLDDGVILHPFVFPRRKFSVQIGV